MGAKVAVLSAFVVSDISASLTTASAICFASTRKSKRLTEIVAAPGAVVQWEHFGDLLQLR